MSELSGPRMADPLWLRCCELWDKLKTQEHNIIVKAMEYMAEKDGQRMENELTNEEGGGEFDGRIMG